MTTNEAQLIEEARAVVHSGADSDALYRHWFHRETGELTTWPTAAAYRAAIINPARMESGWRVLRAGLPGEPAGAVLAMRGGRQRLVAPPEMTPDDPRSLAPTLGSVLRVDPLVSAGSGGFWHVWSVPWQGQAPANFYRLYCRVLPHRAFAFVQTVTRLAPPRQQWAMKILSERKDEGRRDGALLYLDNAIPWATGWLPDLLDAIAADLGGALPPFVAPIRAGVGLAPDPANGRSFGQAVCDAMVSAGPQAGDPERFAAAALAAVRTIPGMSAPAQERVA